MNSICNNISFGKIIKFDNKKNVPYNKFNIGQPVADEFIRTGKNETAKIINLKRSEMNQEDLAILTSSEGLINSPVSFLIPLLSSYLTGDMNEADFVAKTQHETKQAQFYFSFMPREEKENNFRLFAKEIELSNEIIRALKQYEKGSNLRENIEASVNKYISKQKQDSNQQ